jgi:hypothetical protein
MQQLAEGRGTCAVQDGTDSHFDRFQIDTAALAPFGKNSVQQTLYFACDFLMDCNTRFFSCAVQPAASDSTGRRRQICSLRAISSALRLCM